MASLNRVQLIGRLGKDPVIREAGNGRVCNFSIATDQSWKDKNGEWQKKTTWHNIATWQERLVNLAEKYLKKGTQVYVEGAIETRKYKDKSGEEKYITEVVLGPYNGQIILTGGKGDGGGGGEAPAEKPAAKKPVVEDDDYIPF